MSSPQVLFRFSFAHHLYRQASLGFSNEAPVGERQQTLFLLLDMMMNEIPKLPAERGQVGAQRDRESAGVYSDSKEFDTNWS